jgi:hypothetical protein
MGGILSLVMLTTPATYRTLVSSMDESKIISREEAVALNGILKLMP